jgi:signal transduction histidine kinase
MRRPSAAIVLSLFALAATASTPYVRSFDALPGFNTAETRAIAQDARGFMWFAGDSGLVRFDGQHAQRFAPSDRPCRALSVSVDEIGIYAHDECGQLFSVDANGRSTLLLAGSGHHVRAAASSGSHRYAVIDHQLVTVHGDTARALGVTVVPEPFGFPRLLPVPCGVVLSTSRNSWLVRNDSPERAPMALHHGNGAEIGDVVAAAGCDHRPLALLSRFPGVLYRASAGDATRMSALHVERNRGIGLAYRDERLWVSYDIKLLAFDGDIMTRRFAQSRDLPSGGPLLVDAEQSLWIGSISRILQLPEPDAQRYDASAGLVSSHAYGIVAEPWRGAGSVLLISWQGAHRLQDGSVENTSPLDVFGTACTTLQHTWYASKAAWQLDSASGSILFPRAPGDDSSITQCIQVNGVDLAASGLGLIRRREGQAQPDVLRPALHAGGPAGISALAMHDERLWMAEGDEVCDVNPWAPDQAADCRRCDGARSVNSLLEAGGNLYASAAPLGLVRIDRSGCYPQRLDDDALGATPHGLSSAHDGGFWAYGNQAVLRLLPDGRDRLRVVERIGRSRGLSSTAAVAVLDIGQAVWVANIEGFTQINRSRPGLVEPPLHLAPLRASADGLAIHDAQILPASTGVVDLNFAGLSFREPDQLRYRHRINAGPWSLPSASSRLTLTRIQPGSYNIEVAFQQAAGSRWSAQERLRFVVRGPWHSTWWGITLIAMAATAAVLAVYGIRRQRQALLSRQRNEIAADLHDELGSELASVRVLSSLLERADLSEGDRQSLAAELRESSEAASSNLRRLVAHMKSGATIGQLLAQVQRLAERLCGASLRLHFALSEADNARPLPALTYRQLYLMLSEALSNASRHAQATSVALRATVQSGMLIVECTDDGIGFDPARIEGNGLGHLRERAHKLGAKLHIQSAVTAGASVRIEVPL